MVDVACVLVTSVPDIVEVRSDSRHAKNWSWWTGPALSLRGATALSVAGVPTTKKRYLYRLRLINNNKQNINRTDDGEEH